MVKLKDKFYFLSDGSISVEGWLQDMAARRNVDDVHLIRHASVLAQLADIEHPLANGQSCLQQGLAMADILLDLSVDAEAVAAGIVYGSVQYAELSLEDVTEHLGKGVAQLVSGVIKMDAARSLHQRLAQDHGQAENIRKMLLAMVADIRVVLIKLAECIHLLRTAAHLNPDQQKSLAKQMMDLYAPLANRLGLSQIKWELEDLSFRYLHPDIYKQLSSEIKMSRLEREKLVERTIAFLKGRIEAAGIQKFELAGRAKHFYSIYRKMERKNLSFNQLYDVHALRVLVPTIEDCYTVLSIVHTQWEPIAAEFDDYIATPKPNGYQSIHTAILDQEGNILEVQIRTFDMHQTSELGVAAHWRYKEGGIAQKSSYEAKIALLRQVLEWQHDLAGDNKTQATILDDRAYVFTPNGEIVDLPMGATPLDFAYHIHSEVGHRCRGAKVNGSIVPLTYELRTGEQVEILTTKHPAPSRDWLNLHLGYLKTSRARAKVHHWFKQQDFDKNLAEGRVILDRELDRLGIEKPDITKLAAKLNFHESDDMLAALGGGDVRLSQVLGAVQALQAPVHKPAEWVPSTVQGTAKSVIQSGVYIYGVGDLLTHTAQCCKPIPGDPIVGYITQGQGVAIHRQDCMNILQARESKPERLMETTWGEKPDQSYPVEVYITAYDRPGLIRDATTILSNEKINVTAFHTRTDKSEHMAHIQLTIEIHSLDTLSHILARLKQLPNVVDVKRQRH